LSPSQTRTPVSASNQGAIRQLAGSSAPRLRLSERDRGTGSVGGLRGAGNVRPVPRREPQLKLGRTPVTLGAAFAPAPRVTGGAKVKFSGRRLGGVLGGSLLGGSRSGGGIGGGAARLGSAGLGSAGLGSSRLGSAGLGSAGLGLSRIGSSSMGRSLLGG